jgi:hypothetical protein
MRKIVGLLSVLMLVGAGAMAQDTTNVPKPKSKKQKKSEQISETTAPKVKPDYKTLNLKQRANDHLMIQFGYDSWAGETDTLRITGFGRHFNMYAMYDMPFKTAPQWSVGIGVGIGSSNIFFDQTNIRLVADGYGEGIEFRDVSKMQHFKKYKLVNAWAEAPIELRWLADPSNSNKSFKAALGLKIGTMLSATTKGKNLQDVSGNSIYGKKYIVKEKNKDFFNSTRFAATARVGMGVFSISGMYQITGVFKEGLGPNVRPYSIGLTISGL